LIGAGSLANYQGDYDQGRVLLGEALTLTRQVGDKSSTAIALNLLAHAQMMTGDYDHAKSALDESLTIFKGLNDKRGMGYVYFFMGWMYLALNELEQGCRALETSLTVGRAEIEIGTSNDLGLSAIMGGRRSYCRRREQIGHHPDDGQKNKARHCILH
jgi:tetratricopeptide (TPR) repeat protein